jgi:hypothetical protein
MSRFHVGLEMERLSTGGLTERLEVLGLSIKSLADIVDLIPIEALDSN